MQTGGEGGHEGKQADISVATPPMAKKVLFSPLASTPEMCLELIDAVRAYFRAKTRRDAYVDLPECSRLKKAMYGARDAAHN